MLIYRVVTQHPTSNILIDKYRKTSSIKMLGYDSNTDYSLKFISVCEPNTAY